MKERPWQISLSESRTWSGQCLFDSWAPVSLVLISRAICDTWYTDVGFISSLCYIGSQLSNYENEANLLSLTWPDLGEPLVETYLIKSGLHLYNFWMKSRRLLTSTSHWAWLTKVSVPWIVFENFVHTYCLLEKYLPAFVLGQSSLGLAKLHYPNSLNNSLYISA